MDARHAELMTTFTMFEGYTAHGITSLVGRGTVRELPAGEILFREGDPATCVVLVLTGKVDLFVERGAREFSLSEAGPSRLLGELAVLAGVERVTSARTGEPTVVVEWDANAFRRLIGSDVHLSQRIFRETFRSLVEEKQSLIAALSAVKEATEG